VPLLPNDEVVAFASERAPLMTVFDLDVASVQEVPPGHVVVVKKNGRLTSTAFTAPLPRAACSFERIYSPAATTWTSTANARRWAPGWRTR